MTPTVHVLVKCRGEEHLPLSLLVFDTIRVGFPSAVLRVYDNASDYGSGVIKMRAEAIGASYEKLPRRLARGEFITERMVDAEGPTVFIDTDMIFWENCEDLALPEGKLYGGRLIGEAVECGAVFPARIHPSYFFVPDPAALRAKLVPLHKKLWYLKPYQGFTAVTAAGTVCWDVNASLYSALPDEAYAFGPNELNRYDHLFAGTYADRLEDINMDVRTAAFIRATHAAALGPERASLRGLWREQGPSLRREQTCSWRYWSGVLSNDAGTKLGFMHAIFDIPEIPSFTHTSIVDLATKKVIAGETWKLGVTLPALPAPLVPKWHITSDEEYHVSDAVEVSGLELSVGGVRYEGLGGRLWYDRERRNAQPGEGWRWISMRLDDGRDVMLYDFTDRPSRYEVRKGGDWSPVDASVEVGARNGYESGWAVRVEGETFAVTPLASGQEIVDAPRGIRYLEALCTVSRDGVSLGTAYVEILPAQQGTPVKEAPSHVPEMEMYLRWTQGNEPAARLIQKFAYATQVADDLVDADRPQTATLEDRSALMTRLLHTLLIEVPGNSFYRDHEVHYAPLFVNCLTLWDASNSWKKAKGLETRMFSYVTREACARLLELTAYIVGGLDWSRQVTRELHSYYHGEHGVDSFAEWDAEA